MALVTDIKLLIQVFFKLEVFLNFFGKPSASITMLSDKGDKGLTQSLAILNT